MLRTHHASLSMDGLDDFGTCLMHLPPSPTTIGPHASYLTTHVYFPPVLTSCYLDVDFDGPDLLLYS
jgi:hypothetical protein